MAAKAANKSAHKKRDANKSRRRKLTPQQEHFARNVVRGYSGAESYRRSYAVGSQTKQTTIWVEASKLMNNPSVAHRIAALNAEAAKRAGVTKESMLTEMMQNRDLAIDEGQIGAAVTSSRDRARIAGLLKDADEGGSQGLNVHIHLDNIDKGVL